MFESKTKINQLFKSGNSTCVTIPYQIIKSLELQAGSQVKISEVDGKILIERLD